MAFFYATSLMLDLTGKADNLGSVMAVTYGVLFVMTPVLVAILMRFSLFKWYVDPIAAVEIPLFLYVGMLFNQMKRSGNLRSAFLLVNNDLGDDGGMGWLFLVGLFGCPMDMTDSHIENDSAHSHFDMIILTDF